MPTIYLSPSTQEFNPYINGGNEEQYMNLIADAMVPYLRASGIDYVRNTPEMTAATSIQASNAGNYDLHLALHSNAAPPALSGEIRGTDVYFYPTSADGRRAAEIIANNLKYIYPIPDEVRAVPTTTIGEVSRTRAPAVLIEFAYHDNEQDANWIKNNIPDIARNVVLSLTEYFDIPFVEPGPVRVGVVTADRVNVRDRPNTTANVVGSLPRGTRVEIDGETYGWYVIHANGIEGYVSVDFVDLI
ncbi:MAG: N-acetylmuramoyl-L-alanine amidase [Oscillospiraceae bacterium]|nr:N-acetylmuramoyl-L-alanine amidase [Oscillospiraceae bacterium]